MALGKREDQMNERETPPLKKRKTDASSKTSKLSRDDVPFPRGGASILTPLEQRQIQIQAKEDILFEQRTGQKVSREEFEGGENLDAGSTPRLQGSATVKRGKKVRREKEGHYSKRDALRIDSLSYTVRAPILPSN